MSKVIEKLARGGHLNAEQVERVGNCAQEFLSALRNDPELLEKAAGILGGARQLPLFPQGVMGNIGKTVGLGALLGLGASAAGGLASTVGSKIESIRNDLSKAKNYKAMLEANPELATSKVDAGMVQRHFNTLHKFNPDYASDPVVAGTYVQNSLEFSRPNIETINNLVRARQSIHSVQQKRQLPKAVGEQVVGAVRSLG